MSHWHTSIGIELLVSGAILIAEIGWEVEITMIAAGAAWGARGFFAIHLGIDAAR